LRLIDEERSIVIDVIDHDVQVSIIVQVAISGTIGKAFFCYSPFSRNIFKFEIACISVKEIVNLGFGQGIQQGFSVGRQIGAGLKGHEVHICDVLGETIADEQVFHPIGIIVIEECGPTPFGSIKSGMQRYIAEFYLSIFS